MFEFRPHQKVKPQENDENCAKMWLMLMSSVPIQCFGGKSESSSLRNLLCYIIRKFIAKKKNLAHLIKVNT